LVLILLPLTPVGDWFQFKAPAITFYIFLLAFVAIYLAMVEFLRVFFYRRYANRLEQNVAPRRLFHTGPRQPSQE
jgi:hypothetical protein